MSTPFERHMTNNNIRLLRYIGKPNFTSLCHVANI